MFVSCNAWIRAGTAEASPILPKTWAAASRTQKSASLNFAICSATRELVIWYFSDRRCIHQTFTVSAPDFSPCWMQNFRARKPWGWTYAGKAIPTHNIIWVPGRQDKAAESETTNECSNQADQGEVCSAKQAQVADRRIVPPKAPMSPASLAGSPLSSGRTSRSHGRSGWLLRSRRQR